MHPFHLLTGANGSELPYQGMQSSWAVTNTLHPATVENEPEQF